MLFRNSVDSFHVTHVSIYMDGNNSHRFVRDQGLFDVKCLRGLFDSFRNKDINSVNQIIWSYYVFQMWYERYMTSGV